MAFISFQHTYTYIHRYIHKPRTEQHRLLRASPDSLVLFLSQPLSSFSSSPVLASRFGEIKQIPLRVYNNLANADSLDLLRKVQSRTTSQRLFICSRCQKGYIIIPITKIFRLVLIHLFNLCSSCLDVGFLWKQLLHGSCGIVITFASIVCCCCYFIQLIIAVLT